MSTRLILVVCLWSIVPAEACSLLAILNGDRSAEGPSKLAAIYREWLSSETGAALTRDELASLASDPTRLSTAEGGRAQVKQLLAEFAAALRELPERERESARRGLGEEAARALALRLRGQAAREHNREQTRVARVDSVEPLAQATVEGQHGFPILRPGGRDFFYAGNGYASFDLPTSAWRAPRSLPASFHATPDARSVLITPNVEGGLPWSWVHAPHDEVARPSFSVGFSTRAVPAPRYVLFSPKGDQLGFQSSEADYVELFNLTGSEAKPFKSTSWSAHSFGFSPSGEHWWSAEEQQFQKGYCLSREHFEERMALHSVAFLDELNHPALVESPDGTTTFVANRLGSRTRIYELDTQTLAVRKARSGPAATSFHFSPDGERVLFVRTDEASGGFVIELWSSRDAKALAKGWWPKTYAGLSFSPDGSQIIVGEKVAPDMRTYGLTTGMPQGTTSYQTYDVGEWIRVGRIDRRPTR